MSDEEWDERGKAKEGRREGGGRKRVLTSSCGPVPC